MSNNNDNNEREKWLAGIREFADFMERHPEAGVPTEDRFNVWLNTKEEVQTLVRKIGGKFKKNAIGDNLFYLSKTFGPIKFDINVRREAVCERVVVGKKIIQETYVPATPGHIVPEHEEEIVEWRCNPVLAEAPSLLSDVEKSANEAASTVVQI